MIGPVGAIAERLAELASDLDGASAASDGDQTSWSREGRLFAVVRGAAVAFDLGRPIAQAAARTADAAPSSRGADWVELAPGELDAYALDRARAWFELAWRRAGERR